MPLQIRGHKWSDITEGQRLNYIKVIESYNRVSIIVCCFSYLRTRGFWQTLWSCQAAIGLRPCWHSSSGAWCPVWGPPSTQARSPGSGSRTCVHTINRHVITWFSWARTRYAVISVHTIIPPFITREMTKLETSTCVIKTCIYTNRADNANI